MADREWASGDAFTLADCAAAPSLFQADWSRKIADRFEHVLACRARLLARPSFARAVDAAKPFRAYFPLGAPTAFETRQSRGDRHQSPSARCAW